MSGQISVGIPVAESFPVYFTIDNGPQLLIVSFSFEDINGVPIAPTNVGSRTVTLRYLLAGLLPDVDVPFTQVRYEYRAGNPPTLEIPANGSGTYNLGALVSLVELSSAETVPVPGAVTYRYLISANPQGA